MSTPLELAPPVIEWNPRRPRDGKVMYDNRAIADVRRYEGDVIEVRMSRRLFGIQNDVAKLLTAEEIPSFCQTKYDKLKQGDR